MKIAPVSGDMLLQLALGAAVLAGAWYVMRAARQGAADALSGAAQWAENVAQTALNPASDQNIIYAPITSAVTAATGQDNSLGTWWRQITSDDDERVRAMLEGRPYTGAGATGSW